MPKFLLSIFIVVAVMIGGCIWGEEIPNVIAEDGIIGLFYVFPILFSIGSFFGMMWLGMGQSLLQVGLGFALFTFMHCIEEYSFRAAMLASGAFALIVLGYTMPLIEREEEASVFPAFVALIGIVFASIGGILFLF